MLNVYDSVFTAEENLDLNKRILYVKRFSYGEVDNIDTPPTGMVLELSQTGELFNIFYSKIIEHYDAIKETTFQRCYVNLFLPNENPYFHNDGPVITCLFYINPEYNINEGGETQFLIDDNIVGIKAKPGRLVIFDGKIPHRATSFRSNPRITVALKFYK